MKKILSLSIIASSFIFLSSTETVSYQQTNPSLEGLLAGCPCKNRPKRNQNTTQQKQNNEEENEQSNQENRRGNKRERSERKLA